MKPLPSLYRYCLWFLLTLGVYVFINNITTVQLLPSPIANLTTINLGLDLKGGVYLNLELNEEELEQQIYNNLESELVAYFKNKETASIIPKIVTSHLGLDLVVNNADELTDLEKSINDFINLNGGISLSGLTYTKQDSPWKGLKLNINDHKIKTSIAEKTSQTIEIIRKRVDSLGNKEAAIYRNGVNRIIVEVPGLADGSSFKRLIQETAKMTFHLVPDKNVNNNADIVFLPSDYGTRIPIYKKSVLSGEHLIDASGQVDMQSGRPVIAFKFDSLGGLKFKEITEKNKGKQFAIVIDDKILMAPTINEPIVTGSGIISGNFTIQSANELALLLKSGALPATLTIIEEKNIGPELGQDSIEMGILASFVGFILVLTSMIYYYGRLGIFASIGMIFNLGLILMTLTLLGSSLTLPGIAGIALTIGIAVDANVIIFESIKDHLRLGKKPIDSITLAFKKSNNAIVDANITGLIASLILFYLGNGSVKGFAVAFTIGILTSMFSALVFVKMLIVDWYIRYKPKVIFTNFGNNPIEKESRKNLQALYDKKSHLLFYFSILVFVVGLVILAQKGLNLGIDFKGGTVVEYRFTETANINSVRKSLDSTGLTYNLQSADNNDFSIKLLSNQSNLPDQLALIQKAMDQLGENKLLKTDTIGGKMGSEMSYLGLLTLSACFLSMMVYIWVRFTFSFGFAAIVALAHDSLLTLSVLSLLQVNIDLTILIAILTLIGYSINDTVIIFDRIRDNLFKHASLSLKKVIGLSLNETLSRTFMTSLTTLLSLFPLYFFGPTVIQNFALTMIWGILIGTYSSAFVANPILQWFKDPRKQHHSSQEG